MAEFSLIIKEKINGVFFQMEFKGKTAISTGAASGMGLLFAQNWAALGGNVVMCDVNEAALEEKVAENVSVAGLGVGVVTDLDFEKIFPLRLTGCVYGQFEYGKRGKHEKCQNKCRNSS